MTRATFALAAVALLGPASGVPGPGSVQGPGASLSADLDKIFAAPALARALVGIRIESLRDGLLYERNGAKLVMPASNMKLLTVAVAAERLGWDYTFETRLEAAGSIQDGVLRGDLVVTGTGDPSIGSPDGRPAQLFLEWADALRQAGVRRVDGRLIGDDRAFDDEGLGAGWAWDYLAAGYAARAGALSFNENVAVLRITPGAEAGGPAAIAVAPAGHGLDVTNDMRTGAAGTPVSVDLARLPGSAKLTVRGSVPVGRAPVVRTTAVDNPTRYFVEALRIALAARGITVSGGAFDIADVRDAPAAARRLIARRQSMPLSSLSADCLKESQNFYAETFLKALGRSGGGQGTVAGGRAAVRETLASWGIPADAFVMSDGSGLSRYDYVTADAAVGLLRHVWEDEKLRGPFVAALPIGGRDGTLDTRMKDPPLAGRVQAKTGTIANMRALSGYLTTNSGEKIVFSIIANHFTVPAAEIDAIAEQALARLVAR